MSDHTSTDEPHDARLTGPRRAVLDVLRASSDHPSAADVLDRVRRVRPGTGAATVYRSLAHLVDSGLALELALGEDAARFDANTARHDHVVCESCGRAVDVDVILPGELVKLAVGRTGFTIRAYDLRFRGRCPDCALSTDPA